MQWAGDDLVYSRVPLSRWSEQYKEEYGPLNYRTAARTLFTRPYLAHFCSVFRRFFAVFSVLTPGFQKVAPKDRGRFRNGRGKSGRRRPILGG